MYGLAHLLLLLLHSLYGFKNFLFSLVPHRNPKPLLARRRKLPVHLALLLIPDAENHDTREEERVMEQCVEHVVEWCKELEIQRLSVYDRDGLSKPVFKHTLLIQ
jgi:dehydrodolichyl diphosphate syntase complex subunit NUS1